MRKHLASTVVAAAAVFASLLACDNDRGGLVPLAMSAEHRVASEPPTIVLVHGAWADASGWYDVTRVLQDHGFKVVAVQNSLFSYATDIQTTKRLIDAQQGPWLSWGIRTAAR